MRIAILALAITICSGSSLPAQTVGGDERSTVMFDIKFDKIKDSKSAALLGVEEQLGKVAADDDSKPDPAKMLRMVGAMTVPKSVAEAQTVAQGEMPIEMYSRMQFVDSESADKMLAKAEAEASEKIDRDGKTFYRSKDDGKTPQNILMHRVDQTTVEIATEGYAFLPNRDVMSQGLQDAWPKMGDAAIRVAIDVEGAGDLIAEAVEMGKAQAKGTDQEAMVVGYLGLIDNMKNLRLAIDFSDENLLTIQATGVDEKQAKELQSGLDAILGMGKMLGGLQLAGLQQQDPEAGAVASQVLNALTANREGNEVSIAIPHPEGLEALAEKYAPMLGIPSGSNELVPIP